MLIHLEVDARTRLKFYTYACPGIAEIVKVGLTETVGWEDAWFVLRDTTQGYWRAIIWIKWNSIQLSNCFWDSGHCGVWRYFASIIFFDTFCICVMLRTVACECLLHSFPRGESERVISMHRPWKEHILIYTTLNLRSATPVHSCFSLRENNKTGNVCIT